MAVSKKAWKKIEQNKYKQQYRLLQHECYKKKN